MRLVVRQWYVLPAIVLAALAISDLILLTPLPNRVQSWAAVTLAILLPGLLLAHLLVGRRAGAWLGERIVFGVGAGFGLLITLMLALSYWPGGMSFAQAIVSLNVLTLAVLAGNLYLLRKTYLVIRLPKAGWDVVAVAALLLGAAFLRFTNLGYSELHGDEALVALRANAVIQGWERTLFVHNKGPGELLIGATMWLLTGELTEFAARLPFALASWTGVLATYLLGRRWFGPVAGWWAGAMVAVDGYLVAFGRMLQYQSLVFLLVVLTLLAIERTRQRGVRMPRALLLASLFFATGLLTRYEALLVGVPATVLLITLWQREGGDWAATRRIVGWLAWPLLLGGAICAAFYVPLVLDPEFSRDTFDSIFGLRLAWQAAPEVFPTVVERATFYSSSYYFWTLVALTVAGLVRGVNRYTRLWARVLLTMLLVGGMAALMTDAATFLGENGWLARGIFVAIFMPFWFGGKTPAPEKAAWIWFSLPLMVAMFFMAEPGTYVYLLFIPWALVTGMVMGVWWTGLLRWWGLPRVQRFLLPVMILLPLVFGKYVYHLFVQNDSEVLRTWEENRPTGYLTSMETPAMASSVGFPLHNGWQSVASLYAQGTLRGPFDTNERDYTVPDWYLRGEAYCSRDDANYYLLVPYPLSVDRPLVAQRRRALADSFYLWGVLTANGHPHMEIYARRDRLAAERDDAPRTIRAEEFVDFYNANLLDPFTPNGLWATRTSTAIWCQ